MLQQLTDQKATLICKETATITKRNSFESKLSILEIVDYVREEAEITILF